jgi:predicted enzyme related to lactoylglutathione lyase
MGFALIGDKLKLAQNGGSMRVLLGFPCRAAWCWNGGVDVLSSRILLRPGDLDRSRRFYRDLLGLAIYREFGPPDDPGLVFFLGQGLLEVSGHAARPPRRSVMIWIQVRDVHAEHVRLAAAGVPVVREPAAEPWGLIEMQIEDPDGIRIVLVEVLLITLSGVTRARRYTGTTDRMPHHDALHRNAPAQRRPICGMTGRSSRGGCCIDQPVA